MHYVCCLLLHYPEKYINFIRKKVKICWIILEIKIFIEGRYRETSDNYRDEIRTNISLIKVTSLLGLIYEKKMYNNYYAYNWNNGVAFIWTRKF